MPHRYRFYIPRDMPISGEISLPPDEAHHAARVVRVRVSDTVELFNGAGRVATAMVTLVTKRDVEVRVEDTVEIPASPAPLVLLQAWPNNEKTTETIIRRGTELGVTRFAFFRGGHSERAPKSSEKWAKIAVETCKQCHRAWLPEFTMHDGIEEALGGIDGTLLVATTYRPATPLAQAVSLGPVALAIGPEGDFTEEELDLLTAKGAAAVSLGDAVFRSEVAAAVAIALVQYERGQLGPRL